MLIFKRHELWNVSNLWGRGVWDVPQFVSEENFCWKSTHLQTCPAHFRLFSKTAIFIKYKCKKQCAMPRNIKSHNFRTCPQSGPRTILQKSVVLWYTNVSIGTFLILFKAILPLVTQIFLCSLVRNWCFGLF